MTKQECYHFDGWLVPDGHVGKSLGEDRVDDGLNGLFGRKVGCADLLVVVAQAHVSCSLLNKVSIEALLEKTLEYS